MLDVTICIGSSCHLKGSYEVLERLQTLIDRRRLKDVVALKASFCMGACTNSVCVSVGETKFLNVTRQSVDELFQTEILARV